MSGVFRNIDPHPLTPRRVSTPPPPRLWCGGRTHSLVERGWGSIVRKMPDTALYSVYIICKYFVFSPICRKGPALPSSSFFSPEYLGGDCVQGPLARQILSARKSVHAATATLQYTFLHITVLTVLK
jgi:hypothetical protein